MARKKITFSELRVGLLAAATIAILIIFILSVTGDISPFRRTLTYKTRFNAAEGLKEGDEVRLAGKRVGKVSAVEFGGIPTSPNDKPIVVTMTLDAGESRDRVRGDSRTVLAQQGFLGDRVIDITPGTQAADALPDGAEIPSADVAGLAQVFTGASDVLVAFNTVGKQVQELLDNINSGKGTIGKLLHDDQLYVNLNRTVVEAQDLVQRVQTGPGTLPRLLNDPALYNDVRALTTDLQAVSAEIRSGRGTVGKLLKDEALYNQANDTMRRINTTVEKLDRIAADLESGRGTAGRLLRDEKLHEDLQATIASLRGVSDRLEKGEGTAGLLLKDDKLYNNVNQMSSEVVKMLYDFRQNPRKYLSVKVSLF